MAPTLDPKDEHTAPLLGTDGESPPRSSVVARLRRVRLSLPRWTILAAIGGMVLLGLVMHKSRSSQAVDYAPIPRLGDAVRVRILKDLLEERYPTTPEGETARGNNFGALDRLAACLEGNTCGAERNVVVLESLHFRGAENGLNGGEDIWARSMIRSFRDLGYTLLFTWGVTDTLVIHDEIGDLVRVVLWEGVDFHDCLERNDTNNNNDHDHELGDDAHTDHIAYVQTDTGACVQTATHREGIPLWKSFVFHFWGNPVHPLCPQWTLAPEDYGNFTEGENQYIGYSIEPRCTAVPLSSTREHRALILAKELEYFYDDKNAFSGILSEARDAVPPAHVDGHDVPFDLITTVGGTGYDLGQYVPGLATLGRLPQDKWTELLGASKMMLGIGWPALSPSPYEALCIGVPFINVIHYWRENDPENRHLWHTQQDALKYESEPYVYHVRAHDKQDLVGAMTRAAATPIGRYIPAKMRMDAVRDRARYLVEHDWLAEAHECVAEHHRDKPEYAYILADAGGV